MHRSTPFARAHAMMAAIAAAMALTGFAKESALSAIGPYRSRGKGRGTPGKNYFKSRSKYMPHIGAKESAKAVKRLEASQQQFKQAA